jgi:hypothetical protein
MKKGAVYAAPFFFAGTGFSLGKPGTIAILSGYVK